MVLPGIYAILAPITVGFLIGPKCLTGMLGGAIASGMMLAIMMANAGGAWDNSKKYIEIEGAKGGKGTEIHKACIVGDTGKDDYTEKTKQNNVCYSVSLIVQFSNPPRPPL